MPSSSLGSLLSLNCGEKVSPGAEEWFGVIMDLFKTKQSQDITKEKEKNSRDDKEF